MQSWHPSRPISTPPQEPITDLTIDNAPGRYSGDALLFLVQHGARVEEERFILRITFPPNTTIQDLPRAIARRRRITFPDGACVISIEDDTLPIGSRRALLIPQLHKEVPRG